MSIVMKSFQFIFYDNILDEDNVRKKGFVWLVHGEEGTAVGGCLLTSGQISWKRGNYGCSGGFLLFPLFIKSGTVANGVVSFIQLAIFFPLFTTSGDTFRDMPRDVLTGWAQTQESWQGRAPATVANFSTTHRDSKWSQLSGKYWLVGEGGGGWEWGTERGREKERLLGSVSVRVSNSVSGTKFSLQ